MEEYLWVLIVPTTTYFLYIHLISKEADGPTKLGYVLGIFSLCSIIFTGGLFVGQKMESEKYREAFKKHCRCDGNGCRCFFPIADDFYFSPTNDSLHYRGD
jgi:hypothetical protein